MVFAVDFWGMMGHVGRNFYYQDSVLNRTHEKRNKIALYRAAYSRRSKACVWSFEGNYQQRQ